MYFTGEDRGILQRTNRRERSLEPSFVVCLQFEIRSGIVLHEFMTPNVHLGPIHLVSLVRLSSKF